MKKLLVTLLILLATPAYAQLRVVSPSLGGTGISSTTAGGVGLCLKVLDDSPFQYELGTCGSGSSISPDALSKWATTTVDGIKSANANVVGIGTSTPRGQFSISGTSTPAYPLMLVSTSTLTATTTAFVIDSQGRIGIGTSSPLRDLVIQGRTYIQGDVGIGQSPVTTSMTEKLIVKQSQTGRGIRLDSNVDDSFLKIYNDSNGWSASATYDTQGSYQPIIFRTSDLDRLRVAVSGHVGVATTSPWAMLSVNATSTSVIPLLATATTTGTATTTAFVVDSSGRVGIGTSSPSRPLTVQGVSYFEGRVGINTNTPRGGLEISGAGSANPLVLSSSSFPQMQFNDGTTVRAYIFYDTSNGALTLNRTGNLSVGLTVDSADDVGVGTSAPMKALHVNRVLSSSSVGSGEVLRVTGFNNNTIGEVSEMGIGGALTATFSPVVVGSVITNATSFNTQDLYFALRNATTDTAPAERMRITSAGNVGIASSSPATRLVVSDGTPTLTIESQTANANGILSFYDLPSGGVSAMIRGSNNAGNDFITIDRGPVVSVDTIGIFADNTIRNTLNSIEQTRLTTSGFGLGTTTPAARLAIMNRSTGVGFYMAGYPNSTEDLVRISTSTTVATSTVFTINSKGYLGIGTSTYVATLALLGGGTDPILNIATTSQAKLGSALYVDAMGRVGVGTSSTAGFAMKIQSTGANVGLQVQNSSGSTGNLLNLISNAGASLFTFSNGGTLSAGSATFAFSTGALSSGSAGTVVLNVTGASTQTSSLQQWNRAGVLPSVMTHGITMGIGSSTPWGMLSIGATTTNSAPIFVIATSTANSTTTAFMVNNNGRTGIGTTSPSYPLSVKGDTYIDGILRLNAVGTGPIVGNAVLVGGTVTVTTSSAKANSFLHLTRKTSGGTIGTAITYTITAGSFTITSDSVLDTSTFTWLITE